MLGLPLTFTVPLVLTALAALPAIWLLLRITPPQPRRGDFPPLKILADLRPERETPARTPWLRSAPPRPRRVDFPPPNILADLRPERETPARTPWWLLLLRLTLAAFLILA